MDLQLLKYLSSGHVLHKKEFSSGEVFPIHLLKNHSNITWKSSILHRTHKWYNRELTDGNDGVYLP